MSKYNNTIGIFEFMSKFPTKKSARKFLEKVL